MMYVNVALNFFELNKNKIIHGTTGSKDSYDLQEFG